MLIGNKPKEVFQYIYNHTEVIDNMVRHVYQKSISEVLIRILNISDNLFEDHILSAVESIRKSFIHKIVLKFDPKFTVEDHMNAASLLSELVEYKQVYLELVSQRNLDIIKEFLKSESESSKANIYILLAAIV